MDNNLSEEQIQQQMQETRASLTEKLETLEQKVVGTVENATTAVNETVDVIKETVHETVATVQDGVKGSVDSVKDFMDVPAHVERHPWLMLGGSVAVGYCLGTLLTPRRPVAVAPAATGSSVLWPPAPSNGVVSQNRVPAAAAPAEPSMWASEVAKLKGLALGALFGTARELLASSMPPQMGEQLKDVVDSVTRKVGGQPLPSSDWAKLCEPTPNAGEAPMQTNDETMSEQMAATSTEFSTGHPAARRW